MSDTDPVWKQETVARDFVQRRRAAIPLADEQLDVMLRVLTALGRPVARFADLGCGAGRLSHALLDRFSDAAGTLVDFSDAMLAAAGEAFASRADQVTIVQGDLGDPAWVDAVRARGPYDAIVSGYAIHHVSDARKRHLYGEIFGLLHPGGVFVNVEHVASASAALQAAWWELFADRLYAAERETGQGRTREAIGRDVAASPAREADCLAPVEAQCDWLRAAGFQDVDCYFKIFEMAVFGGRRPAT